MSILLENYVQLLQGARNKPMPNLLGGGFRLMSENGFNVQVRYLQIWIVAITIALLIGRCAFARRESRGAHFRTDFPEKQLEFEKHSVVVKGDEVRFR